jgi:hypothetical protein
MTRCVWDSQQIGPVAYGRTALLGAKVPSVTYSLYEWVVIHGYDFGHEVQITASVVWVLLELFGEISSSPDFQRT